LQAELVSEIKQAQKATDKARAKAKGEQATMDISQLYANLLSVNAKYMRSKIFHNRQHLTPIQISKAIPRKDPGDICASHLITA
jgi:hypothetical protein